MDQTDCSREYAYPPEFTTDGSSAPWNDYLSDQDKKFIMQIYPKVGDRRTTSDGVYLVNCFKGDQISSGVAYYSFLGNNDGQQPTAYIDVVKGGNQIWEGEPGSGMFEFEMSRIKGLEADERNSHVP